MSYFNPYGMDVGPQGSIDKRAWALQPAILSTSVPNYGKDEVSWVCLVYAACESIPQGLPGYSFLDFYMTPQSHLGARFPQMDFEVAHYRAILREIWRYLALSNLEAVSFRHIREDIL
jgi:hypothetical protein